MWPAVHYHRYEPSPGLLREGGCLLTLTIEEIFLPDRADTTNDPARS